MLTSNSRVLVVEDDEFKVKAIYDYLQTEWSGLSVTVARSFNGAIGEIEGERFDLAVVDMSLPTYELAKDRHGGGVPQGFAGEDVLRFIEAESPGTLMVVVTQLSEFSDGSVTRSLEELTASLREELGDNYLGIVSYSGRHGSWRDALNSLLKECK